jgi:microsomal dipeptidase-like Zn-dependent dipeptidase
MMDALLSQIEQNKDKIELVLKFSDINRIHSEGKICALASIEGVEAIEGYSEEDVIKILGGNFLRVLAVTLPP